MASKQIAAFRRRLLHWYKTHGRDLPWRHTSDPYAVLVSEIMLQQTQVSTVEPFYNRWLNCFPGFAALAAASEHQVLRAWQGLGYYSRARNLHATAKIVTDHYHGLLPRDPELLRKLPGIGRYTANAVTSFAFDQSVPIVEANTARVLARLFDIRLPVDSAAGRERLWQVAATLVPKHKAGRFNSAMIDLGALVCVSRQPKCHLCPVQTFCRAPHPVSLPIKKPRPKVKRLTESHVLATRNGRILLEQCAHRWRGMWMLPWLRPIPQINQPIYSSVFPFTNHRITLRVFRAEVNGKRSACPTTASLPRGQRAVVGQPLRQPDRHVQQTTNSTRRWIRIGELNTIPIPSPHRRAIFSLIR